MARAEAAGRADPTSRVDDAARATARVDRVSLLFEGARRRKRGIVTPEGVTLEVEIAEHGERFGAFFLDMIIWSVATGLLYTGAALMITKGMKSAVVTTLVLFIAFLVRNLYFMHFELAWRGVTPGKRLCGLKVVDRSGGALTASAIVARNITREVEIFLPVGLFFSLAGTNGHEIWVQLTTLGWVGAIACLPFFNRDHLRGGDLIAGTMVIAMPKRDLAGDLAKPEHDASDDIFVFAPRQLEAYGAYELQVLEELLRQPRSVHTARFFREISEKIARRIEWTSEVPADLSERFLRAFYTAQRAALEREQLFGRLRADKNDPVKRRS